MVTFAAPSADARTPEPIADSDLNEQETIDAAQPPAPELTHFQSREDLLTYVQDFSVTHGYAVVIRKSNVPRGQVWLRCDLGGSYKKSMNPSTTSRKRKSASRLQNCPFQLYGRRTQDGSWVLKVQEPRHNHEAVRESQQMIQHPIARRLTLAQKLLVDELTALGLRPALIIERLREAFPDKPIKIQDIYNMRNYIRRERNAGRVPFISDSESGNSSSNSNSNGSRLNAQQQQAAAGQAGAVHGDEAAAAAAAMERFTLPILPLTPKSHRQHHQHHQRLNQHSLEAANDRERRLMSLYSEVNGQFGSWAPVAQAQFVAEVGHLRDKYQALHESSRAAMGHGGTTVLDLQDDQQLPSDDYPGDTNDDDDDDDGASSIEALAERELDTFPSLDAPVSSASHHEPDAQPLPFDAESIAQASGLL